MGDIPISPFFHQPPPASPPTKSNNMSMLYYGLVVVGTAAIVLAIYNLIIIRCCSDRNGLPRRQTNRRLVEATANQSLENSSVNLVSSFKYRKEGVSHLELTSDYECAVCLSVFEEGEEVRRLTRCKHAFHAACIDMWLYSHYDCPLCRAPVESPTLRHQHTVLQQENSVENSREGMLDSAGISV